MVRFPWKAQAGRHQHGRSLRFASLRFLSRSFLAPCDASLSLRFRSLHSGPRPRQCPRFRARGRPPVRQDPDARRRPRNQRLPSRPVRASRLKARGGTARRNHTRGTALPDPGPCGARAPPGPVSAPFPRAGAGRKKVNDDAAVAPCATSLLSLRRAGSLRSSRSFRAVRGGAVSTRSPRKATGDTAAPIHLAPPLWWRPPSRFPVLRSYQHGANTLRYSLGLTHSGPGTWRTHRDYRRPRKRAPPGEHNRALRAVRPDGEAVRSIGPLAPRNAHYGNSPMHATRAGSRAPYPYGRLVPRTTYGVLRREMAGFLETAPRQ